MDLTLDQLQAAGKGMLPDLFGIQLLSADKDLVRAELFVREDLCTTPGVMHGGAIMAFADNLGGGFNPDSGLFMTIIAQTAGAYAAGKVKDFANA